MAFSSSILDSLQTTLQTLKEIVEKNQGEQHETAQLVRRMESLVADMEQKTLPAAKRQDALVLPTNVAAAPAVILS
jgi:uncharacterized protein YoxC